MTTGPHEQKSPQPDGGSPAGDSHEIKSLLEHIAAQVESRSTSRWLEVWATVLLAVAGCASAWSVYQATRWSGVMATRYGEANAIRAEAMRAGNAANRQMLIDVIEFTQWLDATESGQPQRVQVLEARFPAELNAGLRAWLDRAPRKAGALIPQGTPFDMEEYRLANAVKSEQLFETSETKAQQAKRANQIADNFILTIVLYSTAVFFVGVSTKLTSTRGQIFLLALGTVLFIISAGVALSFPQDVGIRNTL